MRWLRWRRRAQDPDPVTAADLELALERPRLHLAVLFALAQQPAADLYDRAAKQLGLWPPRKWLQVDGARLEPRYGLELMPPRGWRAVIAAEDASTLLLVLASTHRDGFLREAATRALARRAEPL